MNQKKLLPTEIAAAAALAAISTALQLIHLGWLSPWGMWVDLVAIPWLIGAWLYRLRVGLAVALVSAIMITLFDPSTWLGATMKLVATIPMFLVVLSRKKGSSWLVTGAVLIAALGLRAALVTPLNYFWAIPIWTGWSPAQAMSFVPWWAIASINGLQGVVELGLATILIYRFKLPRLIRE